MGAGGGRHRPAEPSRSDAPIGSDPAAAPEASSEVPPKSEVIWWTAPSQPRDDYEWTGRPGYSDGQLGGTLPNIGVRTYGDYVPQRLENIEAPTPCATCRELEIEMGGWLQTCPHGHRIDALLVKTLDFKTYVIPYGRFECWGWYKERLEEVTGIPPERMRLIYAGSQRPDGERHSGLQVLSTVHLVLKDLFLPLQLNAQHGEGGLTVVCASLAGEVLGEITNLSPQEPFSTLEALVRERVPPPAGARWKLVLPVAASADCKDEDVAIGELFKL